MMAPENYRITGLTLYYIYISPATMEVDKKSGIPIMKFGTPQPIPDDLSASSTVNNYFKNNCDAKLLRR